MSFVLISLNILTLINCQITIIILGMLYLVVLYYINSSFVVASNGVKLLKGIHIIVQKTSITTNQRK